MKKTDAKMIDYFVKLAQKESKKKRIIFERVNEVVYFTNGEFVCSFSAERPEQFLSLCGVFGLPVVGDFRKEYNNGNLCDSNFSVKGACDMQKKEDCNLSFTGVSVEVNDKKEVIDVFSDKKTVYFYNDKYTKPLKGMCFEGLNMNGLTCACYKCLDIAVYILPLKNCAKFEAVAKLMNN